MAAGFDGEGGVEDGENLQAQGDVGSGLGEYEAGWVELGLALGPVEGGDGVGGGVGEGDAGGEDEGEGVALQAISWVLEGCVCVWLCGCVVVWLGG